ncbi:MAG TPA: hypothetical protein VN371_06820 [Chlorobaculum sp.]|nr:hypothetical protein [Chlorobaculum sp.]
MPLLLLFSWIRIWSLRPESYFLFDLNLLSGVPSFFRGPALVVSFFAASLFALYLISGVPSFLSGPAAGFAAAFAAGLSAAFAAGLSAGLASGFVAGLSPGLVSGFAADLSPGFAAGLSPFLSAGLAGSFLPFTFSVFTVVALSSLLSAKVFAGPNAAVKKNAMVNRSADFFMILCFSSLSNRSDSIQEK